MSATFEITINSVRTADINGMSDVVKQVSFDVRGSQQDQHFNLPQNVELSDPDSVAFKPFSELTPADVVAWVEANFSQMDSVKAHIQYVLDRQVAEVSLQAKPLPWAEPTPTPTPPAA
jgi:hypothetical protein